MVLVGYPGSGKTMLAVGLYKNSLRKGASITIKDTDPHAIQFLAKLTTDIENKKIFPAPNQLVVGPDDEHSERKKYLFVFNWRGKTFGIEFEDYAGERTSNPEYAKDFANKIIGENVYGAILLLNPGLELFKAAEDIPEKRREKALLLRESMPKIYTAIIQKLCDINCKNIVLAIAASDRISKGGDLLRKGKGLRQFKNFTETRNEIWGFLKKAKTNDGHKVDCAVVNVTVTGQLKYDQDGTVKEVHLAHGGENTAADPFLWIIDPWRMRLRKLVKRLMWIVPSSLLLFASMYVGAYAWNSYKIKNCLDQAESALANFGDPEAVNFDNEKGSSLMAGAESCLRDVNEREWFVADNDMATIDKRLPKLLAMLMTNQVWLAYKNAKVDGSDYNDHPHTTLCGETELESWPYWVRSIRCKASYEAAMVFCNQKASELSTKVITSNAKYLIDEFGKLNDYGKDRDIQFLFEKTHSCSNDMVRAAIKTNLDNLISLRNICLKKWMNDVSYGISTNVTDDADKRISSVITTNTGLDIAAVRKSIFASHKDVMLRDFKSKATVCKQKVLDGSLDLQAVAAELFRYLNEAAESPYKWIVLDAAQRRFNEAVSTLLSSEDNRAELFDQIFRATRKLRMLEEVFNEEYFGDNALYWLAATITNENGIAYKYSTEWLCYDFICDAIEVRTDHATNNPSSSKPFDQNVDAMLNVSFKLKHDGYPKDIGGELIMDYKGKGGERKELWFSIPDSDINVRMGATDVLKIKVKNGKEDWKINAPIPEHTFEFWPGWDEEVEKSFPYEYPSGSFHKGKKELYPNEVLYWVKLRKSPTEGGPRLAFKDALENAAAREGVIKAKREKSVSDADAFLKSNGSNGHE